MCRAEKRRYKQITVKLQHNAFRSHSCTLSTGGVENELKKLGKGVQQLIERDLVHVTELKAEAVMVQQLVKGDLTRVTELKAETVTVQ